MNEHAMKNAMVAAMQVARAAENVLRFDDAQFRTVLAERLRTFYTAEQAIWVTK